METLKKQSMQNQIGPFIIGNKKLGEGASGKVYVAFHQASSVKVAVKVINKNDIYSQPEKKRKVCSFL